MSRKINSPKEAEKLLRAEVNKRRLSAYVDIIRVDDDTLVQISFPDESDEDREEIESFENNVQPGLNRTIFKGWKKGGLSTGAGSTEFDWTFPKRHEKSIRRE